MMNEKKETEKQKKAKEKNKTRREFLLTFFTEYAEYQETEVNGFWLVKSWNGDTKFWQVGIYTAESYKAYKKFQQNNL